MSDMGGVRHENDNGEGARDTHRDLLEKAKREGVSLNQLCLTKLARPLDWYRQKTSEREERKE